MSHEPGVAADPELLAVLESAARLQELVPDAVLVGGSAAALYAGHRRSVDHDHVLSDLRDRFDAVLEAVESEAGWVTNRVRPGKLILGRLGDIEAGVRQMIRTRPLETVETVLPSGRPLRVPTPEETIRIKAFLLVRRNQARDFLDVAALADRFGTTWAADVLSDLDTFYADQQAEGARRGERPDGVASQVARQLAEPRPADSATLSDLPRYKGLARRWHDWSTVVGVCREVALGMLLPEPSAGRSEEA